MWKGWLFGLSFLFLASLVNTITLAFYPDEVMMTLHHNLLNHFSHFIPVDTFSTSMFLHLNIKESLVIVWSRDHLELTSKRRESQESLVEKMTNTSGELVIGIPVTSITYAAESLPSESASAFGTSGLFLDKDSCGFFESKRNKDSFIDWMSKLSRKTDNYVHGIREHVTLGPKLSATVKGKVSLGAKILQAGGVERVFRQAFSVEKGEKLLKAFQCYLSTSAGPIAGMLFISTEKIAFHSDRSLALTSPRGDITRVPYKVVIPLGRIKRATPSENADKPDEKYTQIVTVDDFEFWFMGFVSYARSFKYIQRAISGLQ